MKQIISTPAAPAAIGPYSQAVRNGGLLFLSGQIPLDPATGVMVEGSVAEQAVRVCENIAALLKSEELDFANVVKATVFITDMSHFTAVNEVYARYFIPPCPARSLIAVAALPKGALVEIEVIATYE